jgi:hypothetical protein
MDTFRKPDFTRFLPPGPVDKALAVWTPAVETGEKPQRGFGGRVYFYDSEARRPIKVDGTVAVYAFDEANRKPNDNEPTRVYTFAKEDVKKSYFKSGLGHSYNLFVPWDTDGPDGDSKKISFIVRYIPDKGNSIISPQATAYLFGSNKNNEMLAKNDSNTNPADNNKTSTQDGQNNIQQAAFEDSEKFVEAIRQQLSGNFINEPEKLPNRNEHIIETNHNRPTKMQTTTIDINQNQNKETTENFTVYRSR